MQTTYKEFKVKKYSGTYSETLEAFGLANFIDQLLLRTGKKRNVTIADKEQFYLISSYENITDEMISKLEYFDLFKYISKEDKVPEGVFVEQCYNYTYQRKIRNERRDKTQEIYKKYATRELEKERKKHLSEIEKYYTEVEKIDVEYDVYSQLVAANQFTSFDKMFQNLFKNKEHFKELIIDILNFYSGKNENIFYVKNKKLLKSFDAKPTSLQFFNPTTGKGVNRKKADGISLSNEDAFWISETMKVIGSLNNMVCNLVKISQKSYDLKIFVPEFNNISNESKDKLIHKFKNNLKGNTPIRIDILNILILIQKFIENSKDYKGNIKNTISGLHSVYQKDLGQNKAVVNIAFIQILDFIEIKSEEEGENWLDILKEQISIIASIDELGSSVQSLIAYRNFLNSSNLDSFFKFIFFYAEFLSKSLISSKLYIKPFSIETLNLFYKNMDKSEIKLTEIIENEGFMAVAKAIRNSTVILHYHKDTRKFEPRYGVAQHLQNKSKSKTDLAIYIGEFVSNYNAETAKYKENHADFKERAIVKDEELNEFYKIIDNCQSSRLVGALLASYGFALKKKDVKTAEPDNQDDLNNEDN